MTSKINILVYFGLHINLPFYPFCLLRARKTTNLWINKIVKLKAKKVIRLSKGCTYMVIPSVLPVVDDGSSETPGRINAGSGDGNGGQMDQKHCKPNGKRSQNLQTKSIFYL